MLRTVLKWPIIVLCAFGTAVFFFAVYFLVLRVTQAIGLAGAPK
jgi:hypothetical protein